jgi:hypothetical protein
MKRTKRPASGSPPFSRAVRTRERENKTRKTIRGTVVELPTIRMSGWEGAVVVRKVSFPTPGARRSEVTPREHRQKGLHQHTLGAIIVNGGLVLVQ